MSCRHLFHPLLFANSECLHFLLCFFSGEREPDPRVRHPLRLRRRPPLQRAPRRRQRLLGAGAGGSEDAPVALLHGDGLQEGGAAHARWPRGHLRRRPIPPGGGQLRGGGGHALARGVRQEAGAAAAGYLLRSGRTEVTLFRTITLFKF